MKRVSLVVALGMVLYGCGGSGSDDGGGDPLSDLVTYRVSGTVERVDVTYATADGTEQRADEDVPWSTFTSGESGQFVYVSAQNQDDTNATVRVEIEWLDRIVASASSTGPFTIATADGTLGRD